MNRHMYADFIIAWANGEVIQVFDPHIKEWFTVSEPDWNALFKTYRIKPKEEPKFERRIKPEPKMEYVFNDEVKESIEDVLDCFDFQRVSQTMTALNWTWWNATPEIWALRKAARQRLREAVKGLISSGEKRYYSNSGGFQAEAETVEGDPKIYLTLKFVVSDWDNWDN